MKKYISEQELKTRIELNYKRLADDPYYQIAEVFEGHSCDWPADKEGRALLAFVSMYKLTGKKIPCMEQMLEKMPGELNKDGYFGPVFDGVIVEQQLSGHSWLLRGLCEHYEQFGDEYSLQQIRTIAEKLYLPTKGMYSSYPTDREAKDEGGVSGAEACIVGSWRLSTDIGCAFMSIDGLSHAYKITADSSVKELLDEMTEVYLAIDKKSLRAQTHCTLSAGRGMLRMYHETQDLKYLDGAKSIYELYAYGGGVTYTYHNLNWWNRPDSWSEPCAIVDAVMLALELYKITNDERCRTFAARTYHNAFATAQRANGGAGTDTLICPGSPAEYLAPKMYEAFFCCTMRFAEGLWYVNENKDLLYAELEGEVTLKENGVYSDGDIIYAEPDGVPECYAEGFAEKDGHRLCPIVKYYRVPKDIMESSRQRILFGKK